ncbi:MAG: GNAT family N-acetyltransferase [Sphingobacterium sp.]|jgi:ribosomal protein S18 acetylase RimI-like enzyme|nr:GNAT family N-acetyltransferase [Sphingobacterium sp.]
MILKTTYRPALESDLDFLLDLRVKTMNLHLINSALPISQEAHIQRIKYEFEHALIIESDRQPIGLLKIKPTQKNLDLIQIQLSPSHQGKGLGKKILEDLIQEANQTEKSITLSVLKTNRAKNLYLHVGFKIVGETESAYLMYFKKSVSC